jgi:hypothetical protein
MKNLFTCIDTIFKGSDYNNIPIKKNLLKIHNEKDNAWISIDDNIYSIRKDDKILLKLFKNFYGKDVKNYILHDTIFNNIKFKIIILDKLKKRKIGHLIK